MPLTTIAQQLKAECDKLGISALLSSEVLEIYISPPRPLVIENCQETVVLSGWPWGFGEKTAAAGAEAGASAGRKAALEAIQGMAIETAAKHARDK